MILDKGAKMDKGQSFQKNIIGKTGHQHAKK